MAVCCIITGGLFLAFGIYLWFWLDKRHFYRRNVAGLEEFHSYFDMWKKTIKEYFVKSISGFSLFLGVGLIIMGIAPGCGGSACKPPDNASSFPNAS